MGYSNFVQLLNSKDYGIPQNRNRCFMVSILGDYYYTFPKKQSLKYKLKDILEDNVDEKYYVSEKAIKYITKQERLDKKYTQLNGEIGIPLTAKGQSNWTGDFVLDSERERESTRKQCGPEEEDLMTDIRGILQLKMKKVSDNELIKAERESSYQE